MKNNHRMGGKLDRKWDGPYTIEAKLSKGMYQLRSSSGIVLKKLYSSCFLKEYYDTGTYNVVCKYTVCVCECWIENTHILHTSYVQWNLINTNTVKVKCMLNTNNSG